MRMLLIAGLALIAAPLTAAPRAPAKFEPPKAHCPRTTAVHTFDPGKAVKPRKLNELPPANQYAAVYRHIGGCEVPLVVRYNVGG
jgi:hypothetical protein